MTITYVGSGTNDINGTPQTVLTTSAGISTQAGDLVFVFVKHEGAAATRTITSSVAGNTFTSRGSVDHSNGDMHVELFTSVLTAGGASHTFTCTLGASATRAYYFIGVIVYRTNVGWLYFDAASAQGTSASPSAGSKAPTGVYAAATGFGEYTGVSWTAGSGWTGTITGVNATSFVERRTNTTGETITGNATPSSSMDWAAVMAVFLESAGAPTASLPPRRSASARMAPLFHH